MIHLERVVFSIERSLLPPNSFNLYFLLHMSMMYLFTMHLVHRRSVSGADRSSITADGPRAGKSPMIDALGTLSYQQSSAVEIYQAHH